MLVSALGRPSPLMETRVNLPDGMIMLNAANMLNYSKVHTNR